MTASPRKDKALRTLKILIGFTPWLVSMYVLYWFETSGTWTSETAYRDFMTIGILVLGMGGTFLGLSYLGKGKKQ